MMKSIMKRILGFSNSEKGFTLIEIIAVLVILGILAAVAIPRFTNLQADARNKAASSAIAEAKARLSQNYASMLLTNNGNPLPITPDLLVAAADSTVWGDYSVTLTAGTPIGIEITQVQGVGTTNGILNSSTWTFP